MTAAKKQGCDQLTQVAASGQHEGCHCDPDICLFVHIPLPGSIRLIVGVSSETLVPCPPWHCSIKSKKRLLWSCLFSIAFSHGRGAGNTKTKSRQQKAEAAALALAQLSDSRRSRNAAQPELQKSRPTRWWPCTQLWPHTWTYLMASNLPSGLAVPPAL